MYSLCLDNIVKFIADLHACITNFIKILQIISHKEMFTSFQFLNTIKKF